MEFNPKLRTAEFVRLTASRDRLLRRCGQKNGYLYIGYITILLLANYFQPF